MKSNVKNEVASEDQATATAPAVAHEDVRFPKGYLARLKSMCLNTPVHAMQSGATVETVLSSYLPLVEAKILPENGEGD